LIAAILPKQSNTGNCCLWKAGIPATAGVENISTGRSIMERLAMKLQRNHVFPHFVEREGERRREKEREGERREKEREGERRREKERE